MRVYMVYLNLAPKLTQSETYGDQAYSANSAEQGSIHSYHSAVESQVTIATITNNYASHTQSAVKIVTGHLWSPDWLQVISPSRAGAGRCTVRQ